MIDITNDLNRAKVKIWFREKKKSAAKWLDRNKGYVIAAIPFVGAGAVKLIRHACSCRKIRLEERARNLRFWDNRLGCYWNLKRELSTSERLMVENRKNRGESLGEILFKLNVLK